MPNDINLYSILQIDIIGIILGDVASSTDKKPLKTFKKLKMCLNILKPEKF